MTGMLASVTNVNEADVAATGGADIIDLKNPAAGALGALPTDRVRAIVQRLGGRRLISATTGDFPSMAPEQVVPAAARIAATGVNFVKIGLFPAPNRQACIQALQSISAEGLRLIAVLFADKETDWRLISQLKQAGFSGVMLDTAEKTGKSLSHYIHHSQIVDFIRQARAEGLLSGLAGSLTLDDIPILLSAAPDYLGFRGALCDQANRLCGLNAEAVKRIREAIPAPETCAAPLI